MLPEHQDEDVILSEMLKGEKIVLGHKTQKTDFEQVGQTF